MSRVETINVLRRVFKGNIISKQMQLEKNVGNRKKEFGIY